MSQENLYLVQDIFTRKCRLLTQTEYNQLSLIEQVSIHVVASTKQWHRAYNSVVDKTKVLDERQVLKLVEKVRKGS